MTDNEKRIVAEWCGWLIAPKGPQHSAIAKPGAGRGFTGRPYPCKPNAEIHLALPDYPHSLDACAEFERVTEERGLESEYEHALIRACGKPVGTRSYAATTFATATATPAQRVEAILRVIEETRND